ncbi:MAG: hypothetical protein WCC11_04875 [Gammaproteobacteria bacterium]
MPECTTSQGKDLLGSRWAVWLLWVGPWVLIVIGGAMGNLARTVLWTVGFSVAGAACLVNARRCRRRHCFYTGPLYLLAALASLLYGLHILPLGGSGWNWIVVIAVAGSVVFCCVLEPLLGKYTSAH